MSDTVIKVQNLSKRYRIGSVARAGYKTIRETIVDTAKAPFQRLASSLSALRSQSPHLSALRSLPSSQRDDHIWALKDVSFEVKQGDVVGIIGRNGAGKSTLLKILSKITEPTEGRVELRGCVGSLLEVGTGFHPELTGHENVYMYGAILGMNRWEITRKFDEIVAFAELEKFIETPVKRYSSGMYMRLAFAVAAHLETEILLVDEVLAVGDAEFQKKCLGKMDEVARGGRTVLFVSHNMAAVQSLCRTALLLSSGRVVQTGDSKAVVTEYLSGFGENQSIKEWPDESAPGNADIQLKSISVFADGRNDNGIYHSRNDIYIEMQFTVNRSHSALCVGLDLLNAHGETIFRSYQTDMTPEQWPKVKQGENVWRCIIPCGLLNGGRYGICPRIGLHNISWIVYLDSVVQFEIVLDHGVSPFWSILDSRNRPGVIAPILKWESIT